MNVIHHKQLQLDLYLCKYTNFFFFIQRKLIVVEGSKGIIMNATCSTPEGIVTFDTVKRSSLNKWSERLEVWIQIKWPETEYTQCDFIATDKHGEVSFQMSN